MKRKLLFIVIALLSAFVYLLFAAARGASGFPLDDAWIHQVYARNLATRGEFAFFPGQSSAGSTSPLWAILLSLGYLLRVDFRVWTYFVGALFVGASAIVAARLTDYLFAFYALRTTHHASSFACPFDVIQGVAQNRLLTHRASRITFYVSLFMLFEWHLAWSAVSGMEIPLFILLSLFLLERFYACERAWVLGLGAGLLTLTRPEGVVLAALVGIGLSLRAERSKPQPVSWRLLRAKLVLSGVEGTALVMTNAVLYGLGFATIVAPYLLFNFAMSGALLPNTFYAKNAEYAILFERVPFVVRWLQLLVVPWIGAQILWLPGFIFIIVALARGRQWRALIPVAWVVLLPTLYALRLPVAYQHGRYEMPIVPFLALYGIWGTAELLARSKPRVIRATWTLSTSVLLILFWVLGAKAYATDVAIIDCEMVQTARWIAAHAPADARIAAHDIGALGYFYPRPFIDLAGLVSPEVIPFIRDEGRLRDYLFLRNTQYAIFFPDWYPALDADARFAPVHQRDCAVTRESGGTNMVVYRVLEDR